MSRLLLIADDLTGALDTAVAFAGAGRRVAVARTPATAACLAAGRPDVLAVNLGTRDGSEAEARARMEAVCAAVDPSDFDIVLKKIDSRLKGHPGAETEVLAWAMSGPRCVVLPAIPAMGRVQRGGRIEGHGVERPIEIAPLFSSAVETPDAAGDEEIDRVVAGRSGVLWVGASGLAGGLARTLFPGDPPERPTLHGPLLMAIGSRDPITAAQIAALEGIPVHAAPDGQVGDPALGRSVEVVRMTDGGAGRDGAAAGAVFAAGMAALIRQYRPASLLCCGGETANAILAELGIGELDLLAEISPGLPVCEVKLPWGRLALVTKSGGFGAPDVLAALARRCISGRFGDHAT
ncbi:four-carbon acid sugar kinase family protein [Tropicimonas sp. IMCC34011]|uniref:four-carbon acid sugar kinase family protein n=1 Tax=Tropicimonas sp. IMCC34011 TaxID=2248759 RepID=UPI0018E54EC0|nr:four-carbon acid sugar kinase family protein [Tropicimonas sp. IMCC34011]